MPLIKTGNKRRRHYPNSIGTEHECVCSFCKNTVWRKQGAIKDYQSCGCVHDELISRTQTVHGMSNTKLFKIWVSMRRRCTKPKNQNFLNYGGRGISVCDEWLDFTTFAEWAYTHGYEDGLSIDRIDNDGDYCPNNCQWLTRSENSLKGNK